MMMEQPEAFLSLSLSLETITAEGTRVPGREVLT